MTTRNRAARRLLIRLPSIMMLAAILLLGLPGNGLSAAAGERHDEKMTDQAADNRGSDRDAADLTVPDPAVGGQATAELTVGTAAVINDEPVNLRADATTEAEILTELSTGTAVTIVGGPIEANLLTWYQIETDELSGWVASDYLTGTGSGATDDGLVAGTSIVVNVDGQLNLRSAAGANAEIIAMLSNGTAATILSGPESADGLTWYQIESAEGTGWVASDYLALA